MKRWKQYLSVMTAAAVVISGPAVPMSQVFAADAVAAEVQASDETTDEKVVTLPAEGQKVSVEAEDFTLSPLNGDTVNHVHVVEKDWASNGKIVDYFENGDAMSIKFNAPKAGIYAVTATYRSGRKDTDTPNAFTWEGTNVESGSVDVYGEDKATTTHTVTFFVKVKEAGEGVLKFTATNPKCGPQVDKFDIERTYTLPTGDDTLTVEAEDFTLVPKAGADTSKHIHIIENTEWASGKKMVSWFEDGDAMYMNFYAPAAGDYSVTATYRSGRLQNNPNEFTWEGTNVESGSVDVYGESGATTTHTVTFTVKVTQAGAGVLKFTATNPKCGGQVDKFEFKKKANVAVEGVTLDQTTATLTAKGQTLQLNANVKPEDASNKKVTFASDKEEVATVDATTGVVTAVANGEAKITATTEDGSKTAVCTVTVDIKDTTQPEDADAPKTWGATPNDEQLWYMKQGTAAFCHFGPNTFNNVEWGENYGTKTPKEIFKLTKKFNAEDLVKAVKEAGFSRLILTAKHHDGFCLWSSQYTDYDIASTDYQGDILEEISDACTKYNLDMGCYLSPWDIHEDKYGCFGDNNNKKNNNNTGTFTDYNELYVAWINEICQAKKADGSYKYGNNNPNRRSDRFVEWWMDGAQGSASNRQTYDWKAILGAIKNNNPHCQVFGTGKAVNGKNGKEDKKLAGTGGIHWIGNESGWASNETWAKINIGEDYETLPKSDGAYIGVSNGVQWSVPEVDTKMLAGWFWRDSAGDDTTKSESELADIYFRTVGRGATLLMNLSPNKNGEVGATQLNRFKELGKNISDTFKTDLTKASGVTATADSTWKNSDKYGAAKVLDTIPEGEVYDNTYWAPAEGKTTGSLEINLGGLKKFDVVSIEEYIQKGQTIAAFTVEYKDLAGQWHDFASGKTISAKRLCRGETVEGTAIRINITEAKDTPKICNVGVYKASKGFSLSSDGSSEAVPSNLKKVSINDATREGTWNFEKDEDGNANGSAWGDTAGLAATFTFTGTKAWVVGTADPNHGMMDVYIDGKKVDSVNTQKSPRKMGAVLYTTPDLEYGTHTIKLARSTKALGISKIYYADGSGIFTMKQSEYELMYGGTTEVEITRTGGTKGQAKVNYVTQSAGAEQGVNYTDLAGSVTFEDGETSKKITLTGLENEKADRMVDGKDFYFTLTSDNASIGTANYAHITLYNANVEKTAERIAAMDLTGYTAESVKVLNDAMSEMKALGTTATKDQVKAAVKKVLDAKNALRAADENNPAYEAVTGVSLDKTTAKLTEKGQTVELKATVAPATASIKDVSFATSDANVATVDANGKVTAVGNGTATITVTTDDGNKTAICSVTVELPAEPTPDPVPADLVQKVNNEIAAAADKKEADYTADSWKNYQKALEAATKAAKDEKATKTDLEKALADLQTAAAKLQKKAPETPSTDSKNPTVGTEAKVGKGIYRVTNAKKKTVVLVKPRKANNTSFNVPKSVKLANGRYKVVGIEKNAFKNNRKLKKVVIGSQVTKIGANAFSGAKNLKTITIKSKSLKSVGKNAFKGIDKKCKIKVPAKKLNSYKKLLSKKGQKASVKITK
jgi:alpha-L-fucosidase/uncharacterized protein YjdB